MKIKIELLCCTTENNRYQLAVGKLEPIRFQIHRLKNLFNFHFGTVVKIFEVFLHCLELYVLYLVVWMRLPTWLYYTQIVYGR